MKIGRGRDVGARTVACFGSIVVATAASASLLAAIAQPAVAKQAKVVTVSQTIDVAANTTGTVTAECPKRKKLVGGGFESAATATTGAATLETHAVGNRAWTAVAIGAVDAGGPLTVDAYCRKGASKLTEAVTTVTVPGEATQGPGPETTATATCPKRRKAVAGGFRATFTPGGEQPPPIPVSSVRSAKREWSASAQIPDGDLAQPFTAYAYCSKKKIKDESSGSSQPVVGESATGDALTPGCEKGTLVSGGFRSTPISEASLMFVFTSHRDGDRWAASAIQGLEGPGTLTSFGYCA